MPDPHIKTTLEMLVPLVIKEIIKTRNVTEHEAFELLYSSTLYSVLEAEETKLWHFSQVALADMLNEELETGMITFPEEA